MSDKPSCEIHASYSRGCSECHRAYADLLQTEITALRAKLAAAHTALQLPEGADLVENIKLLKLGAVRQYEKAMNNNARCQWEYRATVAAALAELRTQWNAQYQDYVSKTDDSSWERRQELLDRMRELDATIAKLDLQEQPK